MERNTIFAISLIIGLVSIAIGSSYYGNSGTSLTTMALHTEGRWIKDASGDVVVLKGVANGDPNAVDQPSGNWVRTGESGIRWDGVYKPQAVQDELDEMKKWGVNTMRFLIAPYFWIENTVMPTDEGGTITFRQTIHNLISWARERRIYVIMSGYSLLPHRMGAGQDPLPYPPYCTGSLSANETLTLQIMPNSQAFVDYVVDVARELSQYDNFILEPWNEPGGGVYQDGFDVTVAQEQWFQVNQEIITAVRQFSQMPIVVHWGWGVYYNFQYGNGAFVDWIQKYPLTGTNIIYSTHVYRQGGAFGVAGDRRSSYADILEALKKELIIDCVEVWDKPILIGETGASQSSDATETAIELEALENLYTILDQYQISYLAHWWRNTGIYRLQEIGYPYPAPPSQFGEVLRRHLGA